MKVLAVLLAPTLMLSAGSVSGQAATGPEAKAPGALGRLFFTPERRLALERIRLTNVRETETVEGATLSLDGVVVRDGGKSTVWINGRPQYQRDAASSGVATRLSGRKPGSAVITAGEDTPRTLSVGETVNLGTQERQGILGDGKIQLAPAPGKR